MEANDRAGSTAIHAADKLRTMILDGRLRPHVSLKQEDLARWLGISRTPLRLALQQLAREGLVSSRHNHSATVAPMAPGDVRDLFDMRAAIEPLALGAAFARLDKVRLAMVEQYLEPSVETADRLSLAARNWDFHRALYEPCERPMLLDAIADLNVRTTRAVVIGLSVQSRSRSSHDEHAAILDACRRRDEATAMSLLTDHLAKAKAAALSAAATAEQHHAGI